MRIALRDAARPISKKRTDRMCSNFDAACGGASEGAGFSRELLHEGGEASHALFRSSP